MPCVMLSSASIHPLSESTPSSSHSFYERLCRLLGHTSKSSPSPQSCSKRAARVSANTEMRCHLQMLHELDARRTEPDLAREAMQTTCCNCHRRFFRSLGTASFCSLDCRSSFQLRCTLQHVVDATLGDVVPSTSRL